MGVYKFVESSNSDVIINLQTPEGRDERFYTESGALRGKCKYFDTCLSELDEAVVSDSRRCLRLVCSESEVDCCIILLRLLHAKPEDEVGDLCYNVRNTIGVVKLASRLGCDEIVQKCAQYLEGMPWDDSEEEEILKTLPAIGSRVVPVLARLHPVDPALLREVFLSALAVATGEEAVVCKFLRLRRSAQEQVEYMLVEDDDAPLIVADTHINSEFRNSFRQLFTRFRLCVTSLDQAYRRDLGVEEERLIDSLLDLDWAARVLPRVRLLDEMVTSWLDYSRDIIAFLKDTRLDDRFWTTKMKVMEITCKVLEAVGYGSVIVPPTQRTELIKLWLPFIREMKPLLDAEFDDIDGVFQTIESAISLLILSLPSHDQAEILSNWLRTENPGYPDLSEAFEVWCYRSKVAKRRLGVVAPFTDPHDDAHAFKASSQ